MNRLFRPRVFLAATGVVAAIAATAGWSAQDSTASSPAGAPHTASLTAAQVNSAPTTTRSTRPVCVKSGPRGHCQFGRYAGITGASSHPYVDQNVWSPISGWHQTLHATSPGNWYVAASMPSGNTGVVSYPNTGFFYNKALSRFRSIISSFSVKIPRRAGTNAEASYDIWFKNSPIDEVMIQNDYSPGRRPRSPGAPLGPVRQRVHGLLGDRNRQHADRQDQRAGHAEVAGQAREGASPSRAYRVQLRVRDIQHRGSPRGLPAQLVLGARIEPLIAVPPGGEHPPGGRSAE